MNVIAKLLLTNTYKCICCNKSCHSSECEFPKSGVCICRSCLQAADKFSSKAIFRGSDNLKFVISAFPYSGLLRDAFAQYKFNGEISYGNIFSKLLMQKLALLIDKNDFDMLIPVPLSELRFKERGFNQSALIAKQLAEAFKIPYSENMLFRIRNTKKQSLLSSAERFENVKNAFMADQRKTAGKSILIFDDIYTLGVTMNECAASLLNAGARSVSGISLFRAVIHDAEKKTKIFF